jgi:GT2 family glycosyltransferase
MYIAGSRLRYYNKPGVIQAVAGNYNKWLGKHSHIGNGEEDLGQYDNYKPGKMDYIVGASVFLPKLFLEQAGIMCEDYFLYFEELDWMKTGFKYGYSMALVPNAIVYHKEGASIIGNNNNKKDLFIAEYYSLTSRVRFIKKWYPYCLITVMIGVIIALIKRVIQGKFSLVKKTSIAIIRILFTNS